MVVLWNWAHRCLCRVLDTYPRRGRNTLNGQVDFELVGYLLCARVDADGRGAAYE